MKEFIDNILRTLSTNGFPQKKVSLPTERMYEVAENKGFSFNTVLDQLRSEHQVEATIGPEKIIFSQIKMNPEDMMKQAQEMMAQMDPEELRKLQEMFTNMSPEEKEEILKKGKDLGII